MKSYIAKLSVLAALVVLGTSFLGISAYAEGEENNDGANGFATSISISPVNKVLQLSANSVYDDKFSVSNNGGTDMNFEVYASPYSYTYSEAQDSYQLGFSRENTYTQITRWITFKDASGNYVKKATYTAKPGDAVEVEYRITTPESIPAGGQYAVLFAHTLSGSSANGIKTEASPGLVIYGRAEGETVIKSAISNLNIVDKTMVDGEEKRLISGSAKVKNEGNVDFTASGKLKVSGIFNIAYYETPANSTKARISVIPESELEVKDVWENTPYFGLFNVSWTVTAGGSEETFSKMVLIMPVPIIVLIIILLTIIIIWIIMVIRKRKERRAKFKF
ncbi:hypothetical protein IJ101_01795 [Candidatus Saccharibacteria bacterium]|jgi:hypothetical protein|nr:hypothetical protein [Candidatus Saccharibacteria bacterium]